ncbi:hypothetical protein Tco_0609346 [Tanacetum coccineum]
MVKMVPFEAFTCSCGEGDVVLRQSYKLRVTDLQHLQAILQDLQHLQATLQDLQHLQTILQDLQEMQRGSQTARPLGGKIINSAALLHEVLNEMEKLDLE